MTTRGRAERRAPADRIVYYDHDRPDEPQEGFRTGEAGHVTVAGDGEVAWDRQVPISANSLHAMLHHGVADALAGVDASLSAVGTGRETLVWPSLLERVVRIFYEADRNTYGQRYDVEVGRGPGRPAVQYRLAIDNREYQRTLSQLQFLVTRAAREDEVGERAADVDADAVAHGRGRSPREAGPRRTGPSRI